MLAEENIRKEFQYLDHDKDGYINVNDIEKFMYGLADAGSVRDDLTDFAKLLQEIKENNITGELENSYVGACIDFSTFQQFMFRILEDNSGLDFNAMKL